MRANEKHSSPVGFLGYCSGRLLIDGRGKKTGSVPPSWGVGESENRSTKS